MPHVVLKLWKGRSDETKVKIAEAIAKAAHEATGSPEEAISVSIEDYPKEEWMEKVYYPQIMDKQDTLYVKPQYDTI